MSKRMIFLCTLIIFFAVLGTTKIYALSLDLSSYTFLTVFGPTSEKFYIGQGINNYGEIVGVNSNGSEVYSTDRGILVNSISFFVNDASINDAGEVVYDIQGGSGGKKVLSTERGFIGTGGYPSINNFGEVVYANNYAIEKQVISNTRGLMAVGPPYGQPIKTDINDNGEIVYNKEDSEGNMQIFSTTRGQLTTTGAIVATVNNNGDIVYINEAGFLTTLGEIYITNFPISGDILDMNDHGDIIFYTHSFYDYYLSKGLEPGSPVPEVVYADEIHYTVLATNHPELYPQFSDFYYVERGEVVPEPSSIFLLGVGLASLAGLRKRLKSIGR